MRWNVLRDVRALFRVALLGPCFGHLERHENGSIGPLVSLHPNSSHVNPNTIR
jgi:hypothetical protein